jgi:multimeric flavodoxin WrbA
MRVVAFNGSPRKGGNTEILLNEVLKVIASHGIDTELVQVGGTDINGCRACLRCRKENDGRCHNNSPFMNECIAKMEEADGIIIGSPVYYTDVTAEVKALIDCAGYSMGPVNRLRHKPGAAVIAVRRAGSIHAFDTINHFFLINEMIVPGSSYWNMGIGRQKGDVLDDAEGIRTMNTLGENFAWLLETINKRGG